MWGLKSQTEIMTWAEVRCLTDWATWVPLNYLFYWSIYRSCNIKLVSGVQHSDQLYTLWNAHHNKYITVLLTIFPMLYFSSGDLFIKTASLYLLTLFTHFVHIPSLFSIFTSVFSFLLLFIHSFGFLFIFIFYLVLFFIF